MNYNKNNFFIKLTHNHGISLITLVITIAVVIILAVAVVMSLNNNNVLTNASSARYTTDLDTMQSYLELAIQKVSLRHQGTLAIDSGEVITEATSNVKDSKGTISWKSTDIGNLSGKIIFDEGTDTDTTFYTGYKLPIYGSETKWYVDESGKLVLQTGSRIYGADELPKPKISASTISKNPQKYYGAYVNYEPYNLLTEEYKWRIFYATKNNIFLISADYIDLKDTPKTKNSYATENTYSAYPKGGSLHNVTKDYIGSDNISDDLMWFNEDYYKNKYSSQKQNMRAVAYLLDKSIWSEKFCGNGAEYAVGGPSLEMLFNSYNQMINENIYSCKAVDSIGYKLSYDNGTTWNSEIRTGKRLSAGNELYEIRTWKNTTSSYYIATPSSEHEYYLLCLSSDGSIRCSVYNGNGTGFRPIIGLKSSTKLKEIKEGKNYEI